MPRELGTFREGDSRRGTRRRECESRQPVVPTPAFPEAGSRLTRRTAVFSRGWLARHRSRCRMAAPFQAEDRWFDSSRARQFLVRAKSGGGGATSLRCRIRCRPGSPTAAPGCTGADVQSPFDRVNLTSLPARRATDRRHQAETSWKTIRRARHRTWHTACERRRRGFQTFLNSIGRGRATHSWRPATGKDCSDGW